MSDTDLLYSDVKPKSSCFKQYRIHIIIGVVALLLWVGSCLLLYFTLRQTKTVLTITTDKAPIALGPYSAARSFGDLVFISGQIGIDPSTKQQDLISDNIGQQAFQAMTNLQNIILAAGSNMRNVLTTTIYLNENTDWTKNFNAVNAQYAKFFDEDSKPARATMAVKQLPLKNSKQALVQISAVVAIA